MSSSVTQTTQLNRCGDEPFQGERVYDYLYDPLYTVSSEADHYRSRFKAYVSQSRVKKMPQFDSMFSELAHHPGYTLQLDSADRAPNSVDNCWRGQCREALQQLAGVVPNAQSLEKRDEYRVTGVDRWKYFRCPLIPSTQQFVFYDIPNQYFVPTDGNKAGPQPTHVTVGVQTDYRESETQTDPYTPEYFIQPGTTPSELLQLATLIWGRGLPAGLAEVEMIQRARAKRAWEATLPPLDDPRQLDKRRRMMEEMEAKEWAFREGEIKKLQEARLDVLRDLLIQRDEAKKQMTNDRLNRIYAQHVKDREAKQQRIQRDYSRSRRKLEAKWQNVAEKLEKPGIVRHYTISKKYASWAHKNKPTGSNTHRYGLNSFYVDTYEGLLDLQEGLSALALKNPRVKKHKPNVGKVKLKPSVDRTEELMKKYKAMTEETTEQVTAKPWSCLVKKEKPVLRPTSPRVEEPSEGEEEMELAVIHLQKLLRGRSTQYEMFMAKENHQDLIQELRMTHALQSEEQEQQKADKELVMSLKKQRDVHIHKTSQKEAALDGAVGAELSHLFDTMSKELIRLQEERRIHAFILLAERERRMREAVESGRRQVEEQKRREDDEIFTEVVQVHQESVDLYLEDIILETLEQTADQQAKVEIHQRAQNINDIAYAMEESRDTLQSEEIVSEMMYSFLIPEVEKISVREEVHQRQQRHLQAARSIIEETADHSRTFPSTQEFSVSAYGSDRDSIRVREEIIPVTQERRET